MAAKVIHRYFWRKFIANFKSVDTENPTLILYSEPTEKKRAFAQRDGNWKGEGKGENLAEGAVIRGDEGTSKVEWEAGSSTGRGGGIKPPAAAGYAVCFPLQFADDSGYIPRELRQIGGGDVAVSGYVRIFQQSFIRDSFDSRNVAG